LGKKKSNARVATKSDAIRKVIAAQPEATLKEIKTKLQSRGVKASDALVNKIKYGRKRAGTKRARGGRQNNSGVSKADAIRNMFAEMGRNARPRDVIAALKKRGVVVTSAQVSTLRRKLPKNGSPHARTAGSVSLDHLLAAKQLAERLGGIHVAREAINSLARLVEA
jgi:uncharacterized protein YneF (UPF0154 family)